MDQDTLCAGELVNPLLNLFRRAAEADLKVAFADAFSLRYPADPDVHAENILEGELLVGLEFAVHKFE